MSQSLRVLMVEDSEEDVILLRRALRRGGYEVTCEVVETPTAMRAALENQDWDVITSDHAMPQFSAPAALALAKELCPDVPFIIVSGEINLNLAVSLIKGGAQDYIQKGELARLIPAIERELRDVGLRREQQRMENLLAQTRQNYETFFNTIDEFLFVLDEHGSILHTNTTVINRLGYTREELVGKSVLMIHPPERRAEAGRIVAEMLSGETEFCPVPIITKSGIQIPVETRVSHGFWDGKPAIFGVTKDISKIKLSEEKFSTLFFINPSACGLSDLDDHKFIEVNEAFYTLFGFDKDEVIGKTAYELGILPFETANSILMKADRNGNVTNAEAELKAKNGDIKFVLLSAENIYVQNKKYRFTVVHDITEHRQAEQALQSATLRLTVLVENMQSGILFEDSTRHVALANQAFCNLFSIPVPASALTGVDCREAAQASKLLMSDPEGFVERIATIIAENRRVTSEELYLADGRIFERDYNPISIGDQLSGHLWQYRDITRRKQAE